MLISFDKLLENNTLLVLCGATATGKTNLSIELSKLLEIEVISADSRQVYKYLDIGTAKPTNEERQAVQSHFIDILEPDEIYNAGLFGDEAELTAKDIISRSKIPVVVGGSGLYIQSLCDGFFEEELDIDKKKNTSIELDKQLVNNGIDDLYNTLLNIDPVSALKYSDKNPRRILRALEYYEMTGGPISEAHKFRKKTRNFNVIYFGIDIPRAELYHKINKRAELMWKSGLLEETEKVLSMGFSPDINALNTVGYKEAISYINCNISESEALDKMKQNTRRYAKRQITWFRKNDNIIWLKDSDKKAAEEIIKNLRKI